MRINHKPLLKAILGSLTLIMVAALLTACGEKTKLVKTRTGNTEVVTAKKGKEVIYKLVYQYENNHIVRGEYWKALKKEDKKKNAKQAAPKGNIFSGTAIAKKYEAMLARKTAVGDQDIQLGKSESGFILSFAQKVRYNTAGKPVYVIRRGYSDIPVIGRFEIKTDLRYQYDGAGHLIRIDETNMNVDTLLLNFGVGNITTIIRDGLGRPIKVAKAIGSIPPTGELTSYMYLDNTPYLTKTIYEKAGLNGLSIQKTETITTWYAAKKVPWEGKPKYSFSLGTNITGFLVYDDIKRKNKLDGSKFGKMNMVDKALFIKSIYDMIQMEAQGPKWRLGDLPDVPQPFLIYGDYAWYN